jgi:hypothetical protein
MYTEINKEYFPIKKKNQANFAVTIQTEKLKATVWYMLK